MKIPSICHRCAAGVWIAFLAPWTVLAQPLEDPVVDPVEDIIETALEAAATTGYAKAAIIPLTGEITAVSHESLRRRLEQATEQEADLVILEIDSPGGQGQAMLEICELIKTHKENEKVPTVAWVRGEAISAACIIALACDHIVVAPVSKIGDCQPILPSGSGFTTLTEDQEPKILSYIETEVRDSAKRNGYDLNMCMALIRPKMELYWLVNRDSDPVEYRFATRQQRDQLFGIGPTKGPETTELKFPQISEKVGEKIEGLKVKTRTTPGEAVDASQSTTSWTYVEENDRLGEVTQPIIPHNRLLTMTQDEALAYGFAKDMVANEDALLSLLEVSTAPIRLEVNWSERLVMFISSPMVTGILFLLMLLGAYMEFNSPGVGLPGLVALICAATLFSGHYLTGLAQWWEVALVVVGLALLAVEVFVIPGFGVAGFAGLVCIVVGSLLLMVPQDIGPSPFPITVGALDDLKTAFWTVATSFFLALVLGAIISRCLPHMPLANRLALPQIDQQAEQRANVGVTVQQHDAQVGQSGVAVTQLRPSGKAEINGRRVDVVTRGELIDNGQSVVVYELKSNAIVVKTDTGRV